MPSMPDSAPGTALRRSLRRVLAAEATSNFGSMLSRLAIPWLAALVLQASPAQMALLLMANVVAAAGGALVLGAWVERRGKRAVMLLCDGARAGLLALLALAAWRGFLHGAAGWTLLLLAAAASGVLTVGFELARSAWMAQQVALPDLPRANAQLAVAGSVSEAAAFALGGWIYQSLGAVLALLIDALSYAASAWLLRGVPEQPGHATASATTPDWWQDSSAGLRAVAASPLLRTLAGVHGLQALASSLFGTSFMIFVSRDIGLPTGPLGMVFALGALGAVLGAAVAPVLGLWLGPGRAMALGLAAYAVGLAFVPMVTAAGASALALLCAQQIVGDAGQALHDVHDRTLRQTAVPSDWLARVDAGIRSVGHMATLAGAVLGGSVGALWGTRPVLWLGVSAAALAALWAAFRLGPVLRQQAGP